MTKERILKPVEKREKKEKQLGLKNSTQKKKNIFGIYQNWCLLCTLDG